MKHWKPFTASTTTSALLALSLAGTLAVPFTLTGCASPPTDNAAAAALSQYRTFGFAPVTASNGRAVSLAQNEVSQQLMSRGLMPSSNPDLLVNVQVRAFPTNQMLTSVPHASVRQSATEGHLTIDLVDARQKHLVWQGRTVAPITRQVLNEPQRSMDRGVSEAFRSFPLRAR